jgi:Restriction endonuclease/Topoisomerase DNA binding C4 zinc finger
MARRQKSKDAIIIESVTGLAALVLAFLFFSPGFRQYIEIIVGILVFGLLVWLTYELIKQKEPSTTFRTFTSTPYQTDVPIRKNLPTVFVEPLKFTPDVTELTISEKLRKIDWFQFEKLVELIYRQRGFAVERFGGAHPDGGVDLIVQSTTDKFVVQCKHWRKWSVGVRHIREFLGTLTDSKISKGSFITLSGYTGEAKQLADKHGIQILNESDLVKMLEDSGLMYSKEISTLFADNRKFCPKCEREMVLKTARAKGNQFWGCLNYPRCRFTLKLDA